MFEFLKKHGKKASKKLLAAALLVLLQPMIAMGYELKYLWAGVGAATDKSEQLSYRSLNKLANDTVILDRFFVSKSCVDIVTAGVLLLPLQDVDKIQQLLPSVSLSETVSRLEDIEKLFFGKKPLDYVMPLGSGRRSKLSWRPSNKKLPVIVNGKEAYRKASDCGLVTILTATNTKLSEMKFKDGTSVNRLSHGSIIGSPSAWGAVAAVNIALIDSTTEHSDDLHGVVCGLVNAVSEISPASKFLWDGKKTGMDEYLKTGEGLNIEATRKHLDNMEYLLNSGMNNTPLSMRDISSVRASEAHTAAQCLLVERTHSKCLSF